MSLPKLHMSLFRKLKYYTSSFSLNMYDVSKYGKSKFIKSHAAIDSELNY